MAYLSFLGAAGGIVTGSCYLLETAQASVVIDCGMFQGEAEDKNVLPPSIDPRNLDAIVVTHGHLDHVGRLPLLTKAGYRGVIYATAATIEMMRLILRDSAKLQSVTKKDYTPYTVQDVDHLMTLCRELPYRVAHPIAPGIEVTAYDSGHMIGSVSLRLIIDSSESLIFSGDLGPRGMPFLHDFTPPPPAQTVICEATYGDRDHKTLAETLAELEQILWQATKQRGMVLIPAFSVGRTQQLIYHFAELARDGKFPPEIPIYIDSPMALEANQIYARFLHLFDPPTKSLLMSEDFRKFSRHIRPSPTAETSRALNTMQGPAIVIAGSGMCSGGRILHHLRHHLANPKTSVIITGFQSPGTLGRKLVDRVAEVKLFGELIANNAALYTLGGFSAHAGQTDLLRWLSATVTPGTTQQVFLTHGEHMQVSRLAEKFASQLPIRNPQLLERIPLAG